VVSRGRGSLPGRGFFDLARTLSRGPRDGQSDEALHASELRRLIETNTPSAAQITPAEHSGA
jgi:hypothetical protein